MKIILILILIITCPYVIASSSFVDLDQAEPAERRRVLQELIPTHPLMVQHLYQIIKDTSEILTYFDIDYWACFGTLLGAVRHEPGGLIPWDDDGDLALDKKDEEKLNQPAVKEMFSKLGYNLFSDEGLEEDFVGYKVYQKSKVDLGDRKVWIFLDLFLFEREGDKYVLSRPSGRARWPKSWFTVEEVQTKRDYQFGGITLRGPADPSLSCMREYGVEWNTLALYYFTHIGGTAITKYKWQLTSTEDRAPSLPREPLEDRVAKLLAL
jgi:hypothetical protein